MKRKGWLLAFAVLYLCSAGCGGRTALLSGSGGGSSDGGGPSADKAVPSKCKRLGLTGKAELEYSDAWKMPPSIVHDGEQFSVIWHSQPGPVSSMIGEVRLARVDRTGSAGTPAYISLGKDNGTLLPALAATDGDLVLVHEQAPSSSAPGQLELRVMDIKGVTKASTEIKGQYRHAALAPHPQGHALLLSGSGGVPKIVIVDRKGKVTDAASLITAQIMASLWISSRPGGFAAMLHSTNSNGDLHLMDNSFKVRDQGHIGHGAMIRSPSIALAPSGFAALYVDASTLVAELQLLNAKGKAGVHTALGPVTNSVPTVGQTALVWTGKQFIAIYPSKAPGQYQVHLLDSAGKPAAKAIPLPHCLAVASGVDAAWGNGRLAVATVSSASGVPKSLVCVTVMQCL